MGNKIITEKDFWVCSGGTTPAPFQTTQLSTKKKSEHKYITVADKSTLSWIDFGCKKLMLIMAIIAAVVVVAVVATGGAALAVVVAAGAAAGAAGAAYGAVLGALICGQKAAVARSWLASKNNMIIQGQNAITGDHKMVCAVFGETITFAPHIKSWWQAIAVGASNYIGGILEGMLAGAAIGLTGGMLAGGSSAVAAGGLRGLGQAGLGFLRQAPMNVLRNFGASFGYAGGFTKSAMLFAGGMRGLMGVQSALSQAGNSGQVSGETAAAFGQGIFGMETGLAQSVRNIASGNATWQDIAGLALMTTPVHRNLEEPTARTDGDSVRDGEPTRDADENRRTDEEDGVNPARNQEGDAPTQDGEFEAFEEVRDIGNSRVGALGEQSVVDALATQGYTEVLQVQNNSGHGVDVIARNPLTGDVKVIEVKANSSRLNADQALGGESYAADRLRRAANGERGYGVPPNPPNLPIEARRAQQWIEDAPNVDYEVHRVQVNRTTGEVNGTTVSTWEQPPPPAPPVAPDE